MRHIRTKGRPSDPNREYVFDPCLCRIALLKRIPADPVDGTCSAEKTGSKSPTPRSSIVLSPSAVRIVVPFSHLRTDSRQLVRRIWWQSGTDDAMIDALKSIEPIGFLSFA